LAVAILIVVNFRDCVRRDDEDPEPTPSAADNDARQHNGGGDSDDVISLEEVQQLADRIKQQRLSAVADAATKRAKDKGGGDDAQLSALIAAVTAGSTCVHWFEASMLNCFGLKCLHQYLNIPFLRMKQQSLLAQLRRSADELQQQDTALECVLREDATTSSYRQFVHLYDMKKRDRIGVSSHGAAREALATAAASVGLSNGNGVDGRRGGDGSRKGRDDAVDDDEDADDGSDEQYRVRDDDGSDDDQGLRLNKHQLKYADQRKRQRDERERQRQQQHQQHQQQQQQQQQQHEQQPTKDVEESNYSHATSSYNNADETGGSQPKLKLDMG
jgi:hypothetical protein